MHQGRLKIVEKRRMEAERKVKKAVARSSNREVMTTVDGIKNVNTLLDSGSYCRMTSVDFVKALLAAYNPPKTDVRLPLNKPTVGSTPLWVKCVFSL